MLVTSLQFKLNSSKTLLFSRDYSSIELTVFSRLKKNAFKIIIGKEKILKREHFVLLIIFSISLHLPTVEQ